MGPTWERLWTYLGFSSKRGGGRGRRKILRSTNLVPGPELIAEDTKVGMIRENINLE